jgi:hypothetical protein
MNKVETAFSDKAIHRGGLLLFKKKDALAFISACQSEHIHVIGVDGFYIGENTTQPSMENSIDLSHNTAGDNFRTASDFIMGCDENLYFEIVCE